MVDSAQQDILDFVAKLPPSVNPYRATAVKLAQKTAVAFPPVWGRILRRIIAVQFCVICVQALIVLWLRKKANKLKFFQYNKLGLIHVEVLNEIVVLMFIFSSLTALDLISQEFVERGIIPFSHKLLLRTCKFPISADVCWLFLWICGIETLMSSTSLRTQARAGLSIKLSPRIRFAANSLLILAMTLPGVLIIVVSSISTLHLGTLEKTGRAVVTSLIKAAPTYDPQNFRIFSLYVLLQPAQELIPQSKAFATDIRWLLSIFLTLHLSIMTIYIPTSFFALRGLRQQTMSNSTLQKVLTDKMISQSPEKIIVFNKAQAQEKAAAEKIRKRLVTHALLLYLDTFLYVPSLAYMLSYKGNYFFNNPYWVLIEQVALHGPSAMIGNIILCFLIQNARYTCKKQHCSPAGANLTNIKTEQKLTRREESGSTSTLNS